jgi:hypothetical protein
LLHATNPLCFDHAVKFLRCGFINREELLYEISSNILLLTLSLMPTYLPQNSIFENPQPMFTCKCKRPWFTSIHNNEPILVCFLLKSLLLDGKRKDKMYCIEP